MAIGSCSAGLSGFNTIAFRSSAVPFEDVVSQAVGTSSYDLRQVGLGVTTGSISPASNNGTLLAPDGYPVQKDSGIPVPYFGFGQTAADNRQRATPPVLADSVLGEAPLGAHA